MPRLALLRHGHTEWNREGRIQGRTDMPLDAEARAQLSALTLPDPWARAAVWSSPLARAVETATIVSDRTPHIDPALIEMHWGQWEGHRGKDLVADKFSGFLHMEDWGWDYTPPGGESPAAMRSRLVPWAEALTEDTVAVCHIGVMRVLLAHATGWPFSGSAPFQIKRNRLYVLHITDQGWRLDANPIRLAGRGA